MRSISLKKWTKKYDKEARKNGWSLFESSDGVISIEKIDESEKGHQQLDTDGDAIRRVFALAADGDPGALLALYLDGKLVFEQSYVEVSPDTESLKDATYYLPKGVV